MYIKDISLKNFRNYGELSLEFNPKVNIFLGNNAQGKTNLLEAVYLTAVGKSFRTVKDSDLVRFGEDFAYIKVNAVKDFIETQVEISINTGRGKKIKAGKYIKKDSKPLTLLSELMQNILVVIFSPEDLKIVKDEPERRRRFIDRELSLVSKVYMESYTAYRKTLVQRNTYLKEEYLDPSVLDIWDIQLAMHGAKSMVLRKAFIDKMGKFSSDLHYRITGGRETLNIRYESNVKSVEKEEDQREIIYEAIKESYERDKRTGTTSCGPHRDDISFFVNGTDMRSFGSQGQQRTCALSLKLAELALIKEETGEDAILLLDDVLSELDRERQEYLIDAMKENQLIITGTEVDSSVLDKFRGASVYRVAKGKITK
jgi:DNA replication and repair protein RecF